MANTKITSNVIADNAVGISALNVSDGSNGQVLTTNGSGTLSFSTVSGTTINNNADNRVITGSGTANTLEGESSLTYDGLHLGMTSNHADHPSDANVLQLGGNAVIQGKTATGAGKSFRVMQNVYDDAAAGLSYISTDEASHYTQVNGTHSFNVAASGSADAAITFTEAMKIASNGDVGIGLTNPAHVLSVYEAGDGKTPVRFNTGNNEPLDFYNDSETWKIHAAQGLGFMAKGTGLITFYTTDSETECARWTNNRAFKTKQGTSAYANATSNYNEICSNADATANLLIRQGSTYYADCVNLWYYSGTPNNTHSNFLNAFDSTATRAKIFSNGGFANYQSNDSNLCDEREKKNIVVSDSTWNDVKSWNIKTFHYNEDDDSDTKRYGVIAQDIEKTNPGLIVDWEKQKETEEELWQEADKPLPEGVKVGDVKEAAKEQIMRKAVKEQQMYIMTIKALQEAMAEIESLKARITTLEG